MHAGPTRNGRLFLGYALVSSLGRRFFPGTWRLSYILPGTPWNSWQCLAQQGAPRNTTFIWYWDWYSSFTLWLGLINSQKGPTLTLKEEFPPSQEKKKKKLPWMGHSSCNWFALLAQDIMLCGTPRLVRKGKNSKIPGWEGSSLHLPQLLKC